MLRADHLYQIVAEGRSVCLSADVWLLPPALGLHSTLGSVLVSVPVLSSPPASRDIEKMTERFAVAH